MRGLNRVMIIGTLGKDPEIRYTGSGQCCANLSVATNEEWKDKQTGEKKEHTEWHRIVAYGKLAEIIGEYMKKGSKAYFDGKIQTKKWKDNSGNDRYTTSILISEMQMLDNRSTSNTTKPDTQSNQSKTKDTQDDFDDDIPF